MRKTVLLVIVVSMSLIWGSILIADVMKVPMDEITIKPLIKDAKRSDVAFPHAVHFGYSCKECHHKWDTRSIIVSCTSSGCHDLDKAPKKDGKIDKEKAKKYYKNAYHDMCIGCHKEIKKENKAIEASKMAVGEKLAPTGPTGCNQCHPKE